MATYMQSEYEAMQDLEDKPTLTEVRVCTNMTNNPDMLTDRELEEVTAVFKSFETGLREATIHPKDLHKAMQRLGLNPTEQEVVDIPNEIARKGLIYFPDFCQLVLGRFRNDGVEDDLFRQNMFKMLCGTEPHPKDFKAKKYRLERHSLSKEDFVHIMKNLPDADIDEMFAYADKNCDGKLSYSEFEVMVNPPQPPEVPKPHISDIGMAPQLFSPPSPSSCPAQSDFASPLLPTPKPSLPSSCRGSITSLSTQGRRRHSGSQPNSVYHL